MFFKINIQGNLALGLVSFFVLLVLPSFSQKVNTPVITRLVYGECNDNCNNYELQQLHYAKDNLLLVFSTLNQCDSKCRGQILKSNADSLVIEVSVYAANGFEASKQSVPDVRVLKKCLCFYRFEMNISSIKSKPRVIIINDYPHYVNSLLVQNNHIDFRAFYKNESAKISCKNLSSLLALDYHSPELKKTFNELGNDSIPDLFDKDFRTILFERDNIYFTFSKENKVQSIRIVKGFEGKITTNLYYISKRQDWLKVLGIPDKKKDHFLYGNSPNSKKYNGCSYYFAKHHLRVDFDENNNATFVQFSLVAANNDL